MEEILNVINVGRDIFTCMKFSIIVQIANTISAELVFLFKLRFSQHNRNLIHMIVKWKDREQIDTIAGLVMQES